MATTPDWTKLANQRAQTATERAQYQTPTRRVASASLPRKSADPNANAASFWGQYQPTNLAPLLTAEMKDAMVYHQTNAVLTNVRYRETGQYGPSWVCDLVIGGEPYTAMFSANDTRNDRYGQLAEFVKRNGPMLVGMESYDTSFGNPGYDLCQPYATDADAVPETTGEVPF